MVIVKPVGGSMFSGKTFALSKIRSVDPMNTKVASDVQLTAMQKQISAIQKGATIILKMTNGSYIQGIFVGYDYWTGGSGVVGVKVSGQEGWHPIQQIESVSTAQ